jgi:pyruvate/2-oxoglutarate dehydrogenase complex dihydrolipoamide dehydrogenase (E3) component
LSLERANVQYSKHGVIVNDQLQTSNPRIYASGDICSKYKFTHAAEAMGAIVIQNSLFPLRRKASSLVIPWCTYTDPEVAHVGMYEKEAKEIGIPAQTVVQELKETDRAILDGEDEGFVKVHVNPKTSKILGATIVAAHAGEMVNEITLAMTAGISLKTLASVIHPYPTQAESIKRVAGAYYRTKVPPLVKKILTKWMEWHR